MKSRELPGLLAGKPETDVESNTWALWQECTQAAWSGDTAVFQSEVKMCL